MCEIVIADSEYLEREVLKDIINNIDGAHIVGEGRTGRSAVELCAALMPQMVFLNLGLNVKHSLEAAWQIRKSNQSIVIVLTAADGKGLFRKDLSAISADEFLHKPVRPSKINEIVRKYMSNFNAKKDVDNLQSKREFSQNIPQTVSKEVAKALHYINDYYTDNITLDSVAGSVFLSSNYLSRLFKREVGVNFSSYLLCKRLDEAKRLLGETETPVLSISNSLSFSDSSYFCKVFKKYIGSTPKEFRNETKKRIYNASMC